MELFEAGPIVEMDRVLEAVDFKMMPTMSEILTRAFKNDETCFEDLTVKGLLEENGRFWDTHLLNELFNKKEVSAIQALPISLYRRDNRLVWHFSKNGQYQVKSGYKIAKTMKENIVAAPSSSVPNSHIWKWLWALHIPSKVKNNMWKCCQEIVPTNVELRRRGVDIYPICLRYGMDLETIEHALKDCS
ncbi:hypothetical protein DH2020_018582 [Rehmannia glutinosa]|uniref:Reverse transcriptase zinc-binding domain-containing protein n=1 Tax=Rehmannia glutinosa TaxID=99300 RepID=A0ABR0WNJ2_REHGL